MDNMDDPETTAKISDSAYSNSCSNSQSRRSHSSKSTHSGSNSSGSSGYGGKASTSGSSNNLGQPPKKDKEGKKKKLSQTEVKAAEIVPDVEPVRTPEPDPVIPAPNEESNNVVESPMAIALPEKASEDMDTTTPDNANSKEEAQICLQPVSNAENFVTSQPPPNSSDGFSCVISMHDGVVMYTSASLTPTLGYPKDIWIGRSFIDFVHPNDHKAFASLSTNGLALPKTENGKSETGQGLVSGSTMVCRIRRYRSLNSAFGVKDYVVTFMPYLLKFFFKDLNEDNAKVVYLVIQATPFLSAFKSPNELVTKPVTFVLRHAADGSLVYIDPESVPYLGYLPQDIQEKNALLLYHPDDLPYLKQVYENIVKEGTFSGGRPYKFLTQNGDYIKIETEWSSIVNPWSMKLEYVIAKNRIIEGPANPDVFQSIERKKNIRAIEVENYMILAFRDSIIRIMNEVRTKPAEAAKQQMGKRCQALASLMETLVEETPKPDEDLRLEIQEIQERELSYYERDSVMLGGISPHHDSDSKSSTETPLSYNQLNYNENLQRYFDSQEPFCSEDMSKNLNPYERNDLGPQAIKPSSSSFSPLPHNSNDNESSNSSALGLYVGSPGPSPADYQHSKITESMIHKHNADMEKELVKMHRETRSSKSDREKASNESRKKKKEHLARCNASYHPTTAGESEKRPPRKQGVKRPSKPQHTDAHAQKHHCPSPREERRRPPPEVPPSVSNPSLTLTTTVAASHWPQVQTVNSYNMFGVGIPQQMPIMAHMPTVTVPSNMQAMPNTGAAPTGMAAMPGPSGVAPGPSTSAGTNPMGGSMNPSEYIPGPAGMAQMPCAPGPAHPAMPAAYGIPQMPGAAVIPGMHGVYPMYYAPPAPPPVVPQPSTSKQEPFPSTSGYPPFQAAMPYMVHGPPISMVYGQPFMYSAVNHQIYPMQQTLLAQHTMQYSSTSTPISLDNSNFEQF